MKEIKKLYEVVKSGEDPTNIKKEINTLDLGNAFQNLMALTGDELLSNMLLTEVYKIKRYCKTDFECKYFTLSGLEKFIQTLDSYS